MITLNKIKGIMLIVLGIAWVIFVYNFDTLIMHRERLFDTKAILGFILGTIMLVNGVRIYLRK
jgi:hypothetical protein